MPTYTIYQHINYLSVEVETADLQKLARFYEELTVSSNASELGKELGIRITYTNFDYQGSEVVETNSHEAIELPAIEGELE